MEIKFNFKSSFCTSREQSERLLALGLKKETSDMVHFFSQSLAQDWTIVPLADGEVANNVQGIEIPAWSLRRLIEMMPKSIYHKCLVCFLFIDQSVYVEYRHSLYGSSQTIMKQFMKSNLWENLINCIEWLIKEEHFPKEYLV